jgi:hypothetical protein
MDKGNGAASNPTGTAPLKLLAFSVEPRHYVTGLLSCATPPLQYSSLAEKLTVSTFIKEVPCSNSNKDTDYPVYLGFLSPSKATSA